jgi:hypothetical protein
MPNWCSNTLELTHDDPAMIARAKTAFDEGRLLDEFIPVPKELNQGYFSYKHQDFNRDYAKDMDKAIEELNKKHFGYAGWYEFCNANWGTKWDIGTEGHIQDESDNHVTVFFDSAWSPPVEAYKKLEELGFQVWAIYYEGGMMYCGAYGKGLDEYYEITGNAEWVRDNIPTYIDQEMNIAESMEAWADHQLEESKDA